MPRNDRPDINKYDYALLINEVDSLCPLCSEKLIYYKNNTSANLSQAAHIYPHSPSDKEKKVLEDLPRLTPDRDDVKNLIMLCPTCHHKFDHPRTVDEYMTLYEIKKRLISRQLAREYYKTHDMESEIFDLFKLLAVEIVKDHEVSISYNLVEINRKFDGCTLNYLIEIVKRDIRDYYSVIKNILLQVEKEHPGITELFALRMKQISVSYMRSNIPKDQIYESINDWLNRKTMGNYQLLIPYLTAFYIHNCEVL